MHAFDVTRLMPLKTQLQCIQLCLPINCNTPHEVKQSCKYREIYCLGSRIKSWKKALITVVNINDLGITINRHTEERTHVLHLHNHHMGTLRGNRQHAFINGITGKDISSDIYAKYNIFNGNINIS